VSPDNPSAFRRVRARHLVLVWLLPLIPGVEWLLSTAGETWPWHWWDLAFTWLDHVVFGTALMLLGVYVWHLPFAACLGRLPTRPEVVAGLQLTTFVFIASLASFYAMFYPLAILFPDAVMTWFTETSSPLVFFDEGRYPPLPNLLQVVSLCVVTPVLEEIAFRGVILPRWSHKWGLTNGLLASSALFALMHADPLGAFIFAFAMSVLYLKTQSLALPILCHGAYNLVVWLLELESALRYGAETGYTLEDFQSSWPWAVGAAIVTLVWITIYLLRPRSEVRWKFPVD